MYISGTDKKSYMKTACVYLAVSAFCAVFGAVYEHFSHNVYSAYMVFAFAFPLAGGALPFLVLSILNVKRFLTAAPERLYHSGIAALTVGSIINGILEIYGTTNALSVVYWYVGAALCFLGIALFVLRMLRNNRW